MTNTLLKRTCERLNDNEQLCGKPAVEKADDMWLCQDHADEINAFWGEDPAAEKRRQ